MESIEIEMECEPLPKGNQKVCPFCESEYVHLDAVEELHPTDDYSAYRVTTSRTGASVSITSTAEPVKTSFRGNGVCLVQSCEEGHRWKEIHGFHKGFLFVDVQRLPDAEIEG